MFFTFPHFIKKTPKDFAKLTFRVYPAHFISTYG
jgi:hypothetical protein